MANQAVQKGFATAAARNGAGYKSKVKSGRPGEAGTGAFGVAALLLVMAAVVGLSSCELKGKTTASKTPATPKPAAVVTPAPPPVPPAPLSIAQTDIHLPPAQPISTGALATIQAPPPETVQAEEPEPEPAAKPAARRAAQAPKPEAVAPAAAAETPPAATPPAAAEERPRLQPVYTDEERRRIAGEIERRKNEIESILRGINQSRIPSNQKSVIDSIHSFLSVSDESAKRGDLRTADALSERALILARELAGGR